MTSVKNYLVKVGKNYFDDVTQKLSRLMSTKNCRDQPAMTNVNR